MSFSVGPWSRRRRWCWDCQNGPLWIMCWMHLAADPVYDGWWLGLSLQTRNPRIWLLWWSHQPRALGRAESENWEYWRDSDHQESDHRHAAAAGAELWQPIDVTDCPMWRESLARELSCPGHVTILNHDQSLCVTSVTRVSNLSHLSSNPSLCWGAVSHSHQAQPALTLGLSPSETAACVQCPHSAGARLTFTTEILAPSRRGPIMKSFEYLHNYLSTKTIHVIRLADFVMILELPWATSDLISFWLWAHEVQLSLESPGV